MLYRHSTFMATFCHKFRTTPCHQILRRPVVTRDKPCCRTGTCWLDNVARQGTSWDNRSHRMRPGSPCCRHRRSPRQCSGCSDSGTGLTDTPGTLQQTHRNHTNQYIVIGLKLAAKGKGFFWHANGKRWYGLRPTFCQFIFLTC